MSPSKQALSPAQLRALDEIAVRRVKLTCENGTIAGGTVALNTLWALERKGLVVSYGHVPALTPFGKQFRSFAEKAWRYDDSE